MTKRGDIVDYEITEEDANRLNQSVGKGDEYPLLVTAVYDSEDEDGNKVQKYDGVAFLGDSTHSVKGQDVPKSSGSSSGARKAAPRKTASKAASTRKSGGSK